VGGQGPCVDSPVPAHMGIIMLAGSLAWRVESFQWVRMYSHVSELKEWEDEKHGEAKGVTSISCPPSVELKVCQSAGVGKQSSLGL